MPKSKVSPPPQTSETESGPLMASFSSRSLHDSVDIHLLRTNTDAFALEFWEQISCGVKTPTIKRLPTGKARDFFVKFLNTILPWAVSSNSESPSEDNLRAWILLTIMPRMVMRLDMGHGVSECGTRAERFYKLLHGSLEEWKAMWKEAELRFPFPSSMHSSTQNPPKPVPTSRSLQATRNILVAAKLNDCALGRALKAASSIPPVNLANSHEMLEKFKDCFPQTSTPPDFSGFQKPSALVQLDYDSFAALGRGAAGGPDGWSTDWLRSILLHDDDEDSQISSCKDWIKKVLETLANGFWHPDAHTLITNSSGSSFPKKDELQREVPGKIRPICVGNHWLRLANQLAARSVQQNLEKAFLGTQVGVGTKDGSNLAITAVQELLRLDNSIGVFKVDATNAFNSLSRKVIYHSLTLFCPELLGGFRNAYGQPNQIRVRDVQDLILCNRGVRQGDPLGPAYYASGNLLLHLLIAAALQGRSIDALLQEDSRVCEEAKQAKPWLHPTFPKLESSQLQAINAVVHGLDAATREELILAFNMCYIDDGIWMAPPKALLALIQIVPEVYSIVDLVVNINKCTVYLQNAEPVDIVEFGKYLPLDKIIHQGTATEERGFTLLGHPVGHVDFIRAACRRKLTALKVEGRDLINLDHSQSKTLLLRTCFSKKILYMLKNLPPHIHRDFASEAQDFLLYLQEKCIGCPGALGAKQLPLEDPLLVTTEGNEGDTPLDAEGVSQSDAHPHPGAGHVENKHKWLQLQATLPVAESGLGLENICVQAYTSFIAARHSGLKRMFELERFKQDIFRKVLEEPISPDENTPGISSLGLELGHAISMLTDNNSSLRKAMESPSGLSVGAFLDMQVAQKALTDAELSSQRELILRQAMEESASPVASISQVAHARIQSLTNSHGKDASRFLTAIPYDARSRWENPEFSTAVELFLNIPISAAAGTPFCTKCSVKGKGKVPTKGGLHFLDCKHGACQNIRQAAHRAMQGELATAFKQGSNSVVIQNPRITGSDLRGDIGVSDFGKSKHTAIIDVSTTNPLAASKPSTGATARPGKAAMDAAHKKRTKYVPSVRENVDMAFYPFIIETTGIWAKDNDKVMNALSFMALNKLPHHRFVSFTEDVRRSIGIHHRKAVVRQLLLEIQRCRPSLPPLYNANSTDHAHMQRLESIGIGC
jgi:hypothetical protein